MSGSDSTTATVLPINLESLDKRTRRMLNESEKLAAQLDRNDRRRQETAERREARKLQLEEARARGKQLREERRHALQKARETAPESIPLNERQELFCEMYVRDLCITRAAIDAGYKKGAHATGARLLRQPNVQARIRVLQAERLRRIHVEQDDALRELITIARADPSHYIIEGGGLRLAPHAPPDALRAVRRFRYRERDTGYGSIVATTELEFHDKPYAIGLLFRHMSIAERLPDTPNRAELERLLRDALDELTSGRPAGMKQTDTPLARATGGARDNVSLITVTSEPVPDPIPHGQSTPHGRPENHLDAPIALVDHSLTAPGDSLSKLDSSHVRASEPVARIDHPMANAAEQLVNLSLSRACATDTDTDNRSCSPADVEPDSGDPMDPMQPHGPSEKPIDLMEAAHLMETLPPATEFMQPINAGKEQADRPVDEPTYRPPAAPPAAPTHELSGPMSCEPAATDQPAAEQPTYECGQPMNGSPACHEPPAAPTDSDQQSTDEDELWL